MALISWIHKGGIDYYLTDLEYCSVEWKKRMVGLKDSDPIGHGAIHRFYDFSGGKSFTVREFWKDNAQIPCEIYKKLCAETFDWYFKLLFPCSNTSDLAQIVIMAPAWLGRKALEVLSVRKEIDKDMLAYLYDYTPIMLWPGVRELIKKYRTHGKPLCFEEKR